MDSSFPNFINFLLIYNIPRENCTNHKAYLDELSQRNTPPPMTTTYVNSCVFHFNMF